MKNKSKLIVALLFISLLLNLYLGITSYVKNTTTPNGDDQVFLAEMTQMVFQNEQYQEITSRETVNAIKQVVNRFNVSDTSSIYNYEIHVQTEKESYIFTCSDKNCTDVSNEGWTYSRYSEEEPVLPLNKNK